MVDPYWQGIPACSRRMLKPPEMRFQRFEDVENLSLDLREREGCYQACVGARGRREALLSTMASPMALTEIMRC